MNRRSVPSSAVAIELGETRPVATVSTATVGPGSKYGSGSSTVVGGAVGVAVGVGRRLVARVDAVAPVERTAGEGPRAGDSQRRQKRTPGACTPGKG
ncbi:hypothetical protein ACFQL1_08275 [Halomicroarcula sp. GCM10025709]|uniref:hypothetical protein n=1 Tax=Haloarcula TaxID=2237 RepID=UPI0024C2888F|nr:hypothetical protein [Halomicroarcula sp. YJ-61-S]